MKAIIYDNKVSTNTALKDAGMCVSTITKINRSQDIVKYILHDIKNQGLVDKLATSVKPIIFSPLKLTDMYMFSTAKFSEFTKLASFVQDKTEQGEREMFVIGNVLYTTHEGFTFENINEIEDVCEYKDTEVYCIRLVHKETDKCGKVHKVDEVIIYIPDSYLA